MPDVKLLEAFATPTASPLVIEHLSDEFTSTCPKTGHPDFGSVLLRFQPRAPREGGVCVELKSLKLYYQSFRNKGIFYEAVTDRIKSDLVSLMNPIWLQVHTRWKGRGGISSIIRSEHGDIPTRYQDR
jgi:7-cyano-7-deazaguanine reductase